jgi:hypothetical protein
MSTTPIPPAPTAVAVSKKSKLKDNTDHDDSKKIKLALLGPERGFLICFDLFLQFLSMLTFLIVGKTTFLRALSGTEASEKEKSAEYVLMYFLFVGFRHN